MNGIAGKQFFRKWLSPAIGMILSLGVAESDQRFYVSTNGKDTWSGKLPAPNKARSDGPFASITKARDAIRDLRARHGELQERVSVQIRGGVYYLCDTITFTPEDSGTEKCPISYIAYPGEKPQLVGGKRITGLKPDSEGMLSVLLPGVKEGKWYFRQLFVDDERQTRARCPNVDPADPCRKGFFHVERDPNGFGFVVGNIHNPGDWMEYDLAVPADGNYRFWVYYAHKMLEYNVADMGGHTVVSMDGGEQIPLMNLPDTGGWGVYQWSDSATVKLTKGKHVLRWQNVKGGGLGLQAYALSDDADWTPVTTELPRTAEGKHLVLVQAANFARYNGKQLSVEGSGTGTKTTFHYKSGTFKPSWANAPDAEVHIFQSGDCRAFKEIVSVEKVDAETRTVTVRGKECLSLLNPGDRYFVENLFEELDSPGEWYLNRQTGTLYFRPKPRFSDKSEVVAPALGRLFQFEGDAANKKPVSYLRLSGLSIKDTDYSPEDGCEGYGMGNNGTVYLKEATHCVIENCDFHNIGKYAVCVSGGGDNIVSGNEIGHSAEGGVLLLGSARNTVSDNHIHHCGAVYKHIGGVVLEGPGTDENVVAHNLVHDMSRYGISLKNAGVRNIIEYNRVHHTNLETFDTGGIEVTQHDKDLRSGSIIRNNIVGDTIGYSYDGRRDVFLSWGIYLDSYAGGYEVYNNLVYRNNNGGIMLQGGKDNKVTNNIFVDGAAFQGFICNFADNSTGQVMERNIFYYTNPEAPLFGTGTLDQKVIQVDNNLYFQVNGKEPRVGWGGTLSFSEWQKQGFDTHSLIADPLFVNPKKDVYSLKPESPAFKLGFKAIDTREVEPRQSRITARSGEFR